MQLTNVAFPRRNTRETGGGQGLWLKVHQVYFLLREWRRLQAPVRLRAATRLRSSTQTSVMTSAHPPMWG
jgi:hypothetical protein